eukprot:TRINITY_DN23837_c0_g1_i2.p1 TRINITY_DN23837_c0_g1~~TRINITY_DN23837_c0_g1_i2.p1  ORF type:complete len:114 (-),score=25.41 TRINITY_DN23837_c0_g1_i2:512-853(-)
MELRPGAIRYIAEVLENSSHSDSVRVLGRLRKVDVASQQAVIEHEGATIPINTALLGEVEWRMGGLFSFIGEVDCQAGAKSVVARVCRCMDGLDLTLYRQAVEIRRKWEASGK